MPQLWLADCRVCQPKVRATAVAVPSRVAPHTGADTARGMSGGVADAAAVVPAPDAGDGWTLAGAASSTDLPFGDRYMMATGSTLPQAKQTVSQVARAGPSTNTGMRAGKAEYRDRGTSHADRPTRTNAAVSGHGAVSVMWVPTQERKIQGDERLATMIF